MKEIRVKQNNGKQLMLLLLAIIMVTLSVAIFFLNDETSIKRIVMMAIGVIGTLFFSLCLLFILKRFLHPKDILVINEKGFEDNSSLFSVGFVSWDMVKRVYISNVMSQSFISVEVNNLEKLFENLPKSKIKAIKLNQSLGYPPISITLNSTKENMMEVLEKMRGFQEEFLNK